MIFVDASVWVAILKREPGWSTLEETIAAERDVLVSPIVVWETVRALVRELPLDPAIVRADVDLYMARAGAHLVEIGAEEQAIALDAMARFGKGFHPARLNMGDCFAYACARIHKAPLLWKGDDFAQTDAVSAI